MARLTALSLASRDPWPETDAFLAGLLASKQPLGQSPTVNRKTPVPEVGATAAAVLLGRHDRRPAEFALEQVPEPLILTLHVVGYRFAKEDARKKVQAWWDRPKARPAPIASAASRQTARDANEPAGANHQ